MVWVSALPVGLRKKSALGVAVSGAVVCAAAVKANARQSSSQTRLRNRIAHTPPFKFSTITDMDPKSLPPVPLPSLHPVSAVRARAPEIKDVVAATTAALNKMSPIDLPAGAEVAVAVGSRGISNYARIIGA